MTQPSLEAVAEIEVELGESVDFGVTRDGHRRFTPVLGGTLRSLPAAVAAFEAEIVPGGGDRQLVTADGTIEIDARYDARTQAGAMVGLRASGVRRVTADGVYFRVQLRFETADPELAWLQHSLFVADGERQQGRVRHVVYRVG